MDLLRTIPDSLLPVSGLQHHTCVSGGRRRDAKLLLQLRADEQLLDFCVFSAVAGPDLKE